MMRTIYWFLLIISQAFSKESTITWDEWGNCQRKHGSLDKTCLGTQSRNGRETNKKGEEIRSFSESRDCFLTTVKVDGGYTAWGEWDDCSNDCYGTTSRYRTCHDPTPCNGGKDCSDRGRDTLTKDCVPIVGQWTEWGSWGSCHMPLGVSGFGTGTHERYRHCTAPSPICDGDYCIGDSMVNENCRVVPPCFNYPMFSKKFLRLESPMVIYTSSKVDIYLRTLNKCAPETIIHTYYELYKINNETTETQIGETQWNLKFVFKPGELEIGFYRLYARIGYPDEAMAFWMEESMFVQITHPPPHAFIKGGDGRTIGEGDLDFDANSVSYSVDKGPGNPTGLTFQWKCLSFMTDNLYNLLQFNLDPVTAFNDSSEVYKKKWYETSYIQYIDDEVAFINGSTLYSVVKSLRNANTTCLLGGHIYVKTELDKYTSQAPSHDISTEVYSQLPENKTLGDFTTTVSYNNSSDILTTTLAPLYELKPLTKFYDIDYMYEMELNPRRELSTASVIPVETQSILVKNEMLEFLASLYDEDSEIFRLDTIDFFKYLSESSLTLSSLFQVGGLPGLPPSANATFFEDLNHWLENAELSKSISDNLLTLISDFKIIQPHIMRAIELVDIIGIEAFFQLKIDDSGKCLLDYLGDIFDGFITIDSMRWHDMKEQELFYLKWLGDEIFETSSCPLFNGSDNGHGNLTVTSQDVLDGMGFLLYIRVEYDHSISYFIQHAQSIPGNVQEVKIECRLNCMEKTSLTSLLSLRATCSSCTFQQQIENKFWWNVKNFDLSTKTSTNNSNWQSWMLSELNTNQFVMKANALTENTGYLIESFMELASGEISTSIWIVKTNILPYGGSCEAEDADWGEKKVTTDGWKDEGYRSYKDSNYDWKEQINFRIVELTSDGKEILLYYGTEEDNYIRLKPGKEKDDYNVTVKVQIYDIFVDYTECTVNVGPILPGYITDDEPSVAAYLYSSTDNIEYYRKIGNVKQVAMNTEVAGTPMKELTLKSNGTIFDTDPADWGSIGIETRDDGSNITKTFDELWDMYQHPDYGNVSLHNEIMQKLLNFSTILFEASDLVGGSSSVDLDQVAYSIGTIIDNKDFTINNTASIAFKGNMLLLDKLIKLADNDTYPKYEDYIITCQAVLRVLNNALEAILPKTAADTPSQLDIYTIMSDISSRQEFAEPNDADLTPAERAFIASQIALKNELDAEIGNDVVKTEITVLLESISHLGKVLQMLNYRKQMPVSTKMGNIDCSQDKKLIGDLIKDGLNQDNVKLSFTESKSRSLEEQNVQVTVYDHTPYSWDEESKFITSKTVSVSVGNDNTDNAVIPSKIILQNHLPAKKSIQIAIPIDKTEPTSQMLLYKMFWKTPSDNLIFSITKAVDHLSHTVYIQSKTPPTEDTYDLKKSIEPGDWVSTDEIQIVFDDGLYTQPFNVYIGVRVYLANRGLRNRTVEEIYSNGEKEAPESDLSTRKRRALTTTIVEYEMIGATAGCRVWDTVNEKWDKSSCKLSSSSTINETVCECSNPPGNSFATTFYVPPNTIDFGSVFNKFDLKNNSGVFATVISLILVYFLICVWAYRQDRADHHRWALSYLIDNGPYDEYLYILTVYTGLHRHAGTKSNVNFQIIDGDPATKKHVSTETRTLDDGKHEGFGVGSIRKFVMSATSKINDPSALRIWHDNSGQGNAASWYLNKITIEDLQTDERYLFMCNQWLSLDHDDGCIDCSIPLTNNSETSSFSSLFYERTRENTVDKHMWLSVAIRPEDSNFTRIERLACCLTLLFLTMISNAMFYGQDTGGSFAVGPIELSLSGIYISFISALIAAPPIFLVTYLYKNSKCRQMSRNRDAKARNEKSEPPQKPAKEKRTDDLIVHGVNASLPFWCRYIAWLMVTAAVIVSGFFLILYSMEWGKTKSEQWLLSFFLSFFESMFVVDPLKIIVISVILSWIFKSHNESYIKYDREKVLLESKRHTATPVTYLLDIYKKNIVPQKSEVIAKMKEERQQRLTIQKKFIELVLYMIFLAVLYCVSFSNRDTRWYNINQHLQQQLVTPLNVSAGDGTVMFNQVKTASDFYAWVDQTLIPFLFPRYQINGYHLTANERLFLQDQDNVRIGPMRLRQVRTVEESCKTQLWDNITTCYEKYSIHSEDDHSYCVGWESPPCVRGQSVYNMSFAAWKFVSSADIWGLPVNGLHSYYSGGGYIAEFVVNYNISRVILGDLYKYTWIDRQTRAIFTEFTLYNANDNVFTYVTFLSEFPETGGVITSFTIQPFRPYQHIGSLGLFVFICEIILVIGMVVFAIRKIVFLCQHWRKSYRDLWHILDMLIIILFFICSIMYIVRWIMINAAMDEFEKNKNKFVNFSHIASWDEIFNVFLAFTICLTTFRVMRILSYNERINQMGNVLSNVSRDLCGCFVISFLVYTAFILSGHLFFGRYLETYKDLFVSSTTLINAIIGRNSINDLFSIEPVLGRVYYFLFVLFLLWILMTMLNATLNVGITSVRQKHIESQYGFTDILLSVFGETVGSVMASYKPKDVKEKDKQNKYLWNEDTSIDIESIRFSTDKSKQKLGENQDGWW